MKSKSKFQKRVVGDIIKVSLGDGFHTYARVLEEALFAFYDGRVNHELAVDEILTLPILFQVPVMHHAVKSGRWNIIGSAPLSESLARPPPRFMQDALKKDVFSIYENGQIRPATKEECMGLEREAVWDPSHVEDRLRDYYAGLENKWVKSLKIQS